MKKSDLKYLIAYLGPLFCFCGIYFKGWLSPGMFYLAFLIIPLLEPLLKYNKRDDILDPSRKDVRFFDILLYLHLPIVYGLLFYAMYTYFNYSLSNLEVMGLVLNVGTVLGSMGINIAHELGHRDTLYERILSQLLLLPSLYMHFQIEHNHGHHRNVATPEDPSTARKNEPIYLFWLRSISGVYINAWKISNRLARSQSGFKYILHNKMILFTILQLLYLLAIYYLFNWSTLLFAIACALVSVLLLESVNYIEHYGLSRSKISDLRYEPVQIHHSWNSNHPLGRIFLFELTRHADHHHQSNKPYQTLNYYKESPQLPMGYPAAILLSLLPPVWFNTVNPLLK